MAIRNLTFIPAAGPSALFILPCNESSGTNAPDISGNGNDGTLTGGAVFEALTGGEGDGSAYAVRFDGIDSSISMGNLDFINDAEATLACWFNATDFGGNPRDLRLMAKATSTTEADHWLMLSTIKVGSGTRLMARFKIGGTTTSLTGGTNISTGTWYHAAATYDGSAIRVYLDAVQDGIATGLSGALSADGTIPITIGSQGGDKYWDGLIDDVRIVNKALSVAELEALAGV